MKLPISWMQDWIEVDASVDDVAGALTRRGFYVEGVERHGRAYPGVVVARVLEVRKHPNADKLSLCLVDTGAGTLQIVCGAPNVVPGMIAPLATIGATLPGGTTIRKSKIRGEESQGMLCSARELELSEDHQGILDLTTLDPGAAKLALGSPFDRLMPPPDAVLEIETPFNRPDGLGIIGLAREVKAAFGGRWTEAAQARLARGATDGTAFDLAIEDAEGCPRYIAQVIDGVRIAPSPAWVRDRLALMGQRPINNVVDATNLVLFELSQPLHAFDVARLGGPAIRVRRARAGESIVTLDGKPHTLDPEVLVIADRERPVAVAGVMGGADSEVTETTRSLLLECAVFEPRRVRRGARRLGLATEASRRYERGVDHHIGPAAVARFIEVVRETCPDLTLGAARDVIASATELRRVTLRRSRVRRIAGLDVPDAEIVRHLAALEFGVEPADPLRVTVPSWRPDVEIEDDLVEEVALWFGSAGIPVPRLETAGAYATRSPAEKLREQSRRAMLARGLHEAWSGSLVSEREALAAARLLGQSDEQIVRLRNPMSREGEVLRPNLVPGLLRACAHNLSQGRDSVRLFEVGTAFSAGDPLPVETSMLAAIVCGAPYAHAHTDASVTPKDTSMHGLEFGGAKGVWEAWLEELRVDSPEWRAYSGAGWKLGASAELASGASRIGWAGTLGPALLGEWDIELPVHLFVALLDPIRDSVHRKSFVPPGKYPPVRRDLAFFVPQDVTHRTLEQALVGSAGEWLDSIELFDVYTGPGTPPGMKSMAYALQFRHPGRTLTEAEIQSLQERIVAAIVKDFGGRLRER